MNKEEVLALINTLDIEEIEKFEIQYYSERSYGYQDDRKIRRLEFNK